MTAPGNRMSLLSGARPLPVWWEGREPAPVSDPVAGTVRADLVIVGAGLTGLWAAGSSCSRGSMSGPEPPAATAGSCRRP